MNARGEHSLAAAPDDARSTGLRRDLVLAHANGALWSAGNALTTGPLVVYLARALGIEGTGVALLLAAPLAVGLLRLSAEPVVGWFGSRKRACLWLSAVSYALLLLLPVLAVAMSTAPALSTAWATAALVAVVCVHQLPEYLAQAALYSWLGNLIPPPLHGRFFGRRNTWQMAILIPFLTAAGWLSDYLVGRFPQQKPLVYAALFSVGVLVLWASLAPLLQLREVARRRSPERSPESAPTGASPWWSPLIHREFRWLLAYGCWFSWSNGLTQTAQNLYPREVLQLEVWAPLLARVLMRAGQLGYGHYAGRAVDRGGSLPLLAGSHCIAALGLGSLAAARPDFIAPFFVAWLLWSAFAGLNVGLPALLLRVVPTGQATAGNALYWGLSGACYAVSTVLGGVVHDQLHTLWPADAWLDRHQAQLVVGMGFRLLGVLLLLPVFLPGPRRG